MNCVRLEKLKLSGCKYLTSDFIVSILDNVKKYHASKDMDQSPSDFDKRYLKNDERTAFDSLKLLDLQMCDLIVDSELQRLKDLYGGMRIVNYYNEEIE